MCGIAGIHAYRDDSPLVDTDELLRIRDQMIKRGPDGAGLWVDPTRQIGLAHRRLAIIDLSETGAQPMSTPDGRFTVTFNGEIYNFRELRAELEKDGTVFRSHSDTEVLLHLYRKHGAEMLHKLRGMYAFGLWDAAERTLFLARDPFGIKPLYYADDGKTVRFASQVKALVAGDRIQRSIEPAAQVGFFVWGAVPEPFTICKGVLALPAGAWLQVKQGQAGSPVRHYSIAEAFSRAEAAPRSKTTREEQLEAVLGSFQNSVRAHMVADVPVGLFLSAGIDSNLIARYARDATSQPIKAITLAFEEYANTALDELPVAVLAARELALDHAVRHVNQTDFRREIDSLFAAMDQPTIDGVNSYFVSKVTAEAGIKVALSGLGGDEVLAGYPSFSQVPRLVRRISALPAPLRALGPTVRRLLSPLLPTRHVSPKYAGTLEFGGTWFGAYLLRRALHMPWEVPGVLSNAEALSAWEAILETQRHEREKVERIEHPQLKVSYLELSYYLRNQLVRDTDWAGMAHSLEVRVPFLDVPFMECVAASVSAVSDVTKHALARTSAARLPAAVLVRPKSGFVVPVHEWLMDRGYPLRGLRGWSQRVATHWAFPMLRSLDRIIVFRFGQIGDTLAALPSLWALRRQFPTAELLMLSEIPAKSTHLPPETVLPSTGLINRYEKYPGGASLKNLLTAWRSIRRLRKGGFATLVYLVPTERTKWSRVRDRIFFASVGIRHLIARRGFSDTSRPRSSDGSLVRVGRETDSLLERLRVDGVPIPAAGPDAMELGITDTERKRASDWWRRNIGSQPMPAGWVAVCTGGKVTSKMWPWERYGEVVRRLIDSHGLLPVIVGGPEDRETGERLVALWGSGLCAAGELSVRESAALMESARFYLGNDTGAMHLAAAVQRPCVAIFSARDWPGRWEPYGEIHKVLRFDVPCSGCRLSVCDQNLQCLTSISVQEVYDACADVLSRGPTFPTHADA